MREWKSYGHSEVKNFHPTKKFWAEGGRREIEREGGGVQSQSRSFPLTPHLPPSLPPPVFTVCWMFSEVGKGGGIERGGRDVHQHYVHARASSSYRQGIWGLSRAKRRGIGGMGERS